MFSSFKRFNFVLSMLRGHWQLGKWNPMGNIGEYWGNDLWRHWCHFPCKLINRKYVFLCIFDTRCQKEKSFIVLQKSKSLENQPEKIFNILSSSFFVNNFLYHFYHNVKQKTKIPLRKPRYNKQKNQEMNCQRSESKQTTKYPPIPGRI